MNPWLVSFKLDLRSLALGRILLGIILSVEFLLCLLHRHRFYTEFGLLPRAELVKVWDPETLTSLYFLASWPGIHMILLILSLITSIAFAVGYRCRLASVFLWILIISIQERNPLILIGSDAWVRATLFWLMFLPLGEYFSWDAKMRPREDAQPSPRDTTVANAASLGLILQVCFVYCYAGVAKHGPDWWDGQAISTILQGKEFSYGLAEWLLFFPGVLSVITILIPWMEIASALLLLVPYRNDAFRMLALIPLISMHLGIWTCMRLYHFSPMAIATLLLLAPGTLWFRLGRSERIAKAYLSTPLTIFLLLNTLGVGVYNGYRLSLEGTPSASLSRTADLLGLNQRWNLFAPEAPKQCYIIYAVAELADGSQQFLSFWGEKRSEAPSIDDPQFSVRLSRFWRSLYECPPAQRQIRLKAYATWFDRRWGRLYPEQNNELKVVRLYHQIYPTLASYEDSPPKPPGIAIEHRRE